MADKVEEFFHELEDKGHQPLLAKVKGTVRFDLENGSEPTNHWLVDVDRGDFTITKENIAADCVIQSDRELFERLITGQENAIAATMRGALVCLGNVELLFAIQRIFPGPPSKRKEVGEEMSSA